MCMEKSGVILQYLSKATHAKRLYRILKKLVLPCVICHMHSMRWPTHASAGEWKHNYNIQLQALNFMNSAKSKQAVSASQRFTKWLNG